MKPIRTIEKRKIAVDRSPIIFLNDKDFTDYIGIEGQAYTISEDEDCACCYSLISIKNAGDYVIILPDYSRLKKYNYNHSDAATFGNIDYSFELKYPFGRNPEGILFFTQAQYNQLCTLLPSCPRQDTLAQLTKSDAAYIVCSEFSMNELITLNFSLTSKMKHELYLTTTATQEKEILTILEKMLKEYALSDEPVVLTPSQEDISIILDTPLYFEWKPLALTSAGYTLRLEAGFQVQKI